jgi:ectoine hydroxylase-related dioxygenase (phytanoyl-CoA dioxygenase family)
MPINRDFWTQRGYSVLPSFYSEDEISRIEEARANSWNGHAERLVVEDLVTGERLLLADVSPEARRSHRFKVNDEYLESSQIRWAALNERIIPILAELLGHRPVLCNSLALAHGSAQPYHADSLFMTPRTDGHLIAIWVALEDCHPDAGPLLYYPGSQLIPPYRFSNGGRHLVPDEEPQWRTYMDREIDARGLSLEKFAARKGDVFIWSANLLHGGAPIKNTSLTRKSIVFHFHSEADTRATFSPLVAESGAFWLYRRHISVNGHRGALPSMRKGRLALTLYAREAARSARDIFQAAKRRAAPSRAP